MIRGAAYGLESAKFGTDGAPAHPARAAALLAGDAATDKVFVRGRVEGDEPPPPRRARCPLAAAAPGTLVYRSGRQMTDSVSAPRRPLRAFGRAEIHNATRPGDSVAVAIGATSAEPDRGFLAAAVPADRLGDG